jgi:uncharacterized protein
MNQEIQDVIDILSMIEEDEAVPKKVKEKVVNIIHSLKDEGELSLKIHKCLDELDKIAEDVNLQTFIRTQVWNASSMLEKVGN